ncbi:MAG TPA: hypothetical protein VFI15_08645, partial [Candidatus Limnocylindrales bacterium]|nr:hypothetical protein [Candidatus Limnocylindrales bacterium]
ALLQATLRSMGCAQRPAALLALGSFAIAAPALALRPQLFAIVLFAASAYVVADRRAHPRRLWLLPVFAALWANLHGTFPLILVIVGLGWVDELARRRLARQARAAAPKGFKQPPDPVAASRLRGSTGIALLGAVTAVATLLNPFGIEAWWYVVRLASNREVSAGISEWRPPSPIDPTGAVFYISLLIAVAVLALRIRADGNRMGLPILAPVATLLGFGLLGVVTGRGLAWWALVLPIAGASLAHESNLTRVLPRVLAPLGTLLSGPRHVRADGSPEPPGSAAATAAAARARRGAPLNFAVGVVLALAAVALLPLWRPLGPAGVPLGTLSYAPQQLVVALRNAPIAKPPGRPLHVWAPQTWGSWLELAAPEVAVAADSRVELFPPSFWADVATVDAGGARALEILARYDVDVVVIPVEQRNGALFHALVTSNAWGRVYYETDVDAELFVRTQPQP